MATEQEGEGAGSIIPDEAMTHGPSTPTLETDHFVMRQLVRDDAEVLLSTLSDPKQCEHMLTSAFDSVQALGDWLCDAEWSGRSWSAIDKDTGEFAARIIAVPKADRTAEIGYITVVHRQGEGIASECVLRLLEQLFDVEEHHRLLQAPIRAMVPQTAFWRNSGSAVKRISCKT